MMNGLEQDMIMIVKYYINWIIILMEKEKNITMVN